METTTLVIAVIGLALSVASLVWQAATYLLEGPRAKAELRVGAVAPSGTHAHQPVKPGWQRHVQQMQAQGMTTPIAVVEVRNVGRHPTSVEGYSAKTDTGISVGLMTPPRGCPPLPHRLEPHSRVVYYLPLEDLVDMLEAAAASGKAAAKVVMTATLGNGKTVETKAAFAASDLRRR